MLLQIPALLSADEVRQARQLLEGAPWAGGPGAEVMKRTAAPMAGGMITAPLMAMLVLPAAYWLMRRKRSGK